MEEAIYCSLPRVPKIPTLRFFNLYPSIGFRLNPILLGNYRVPRWGKFFTTKDNGNVQRNMQHEPTNITQCLFCPYSTRTYGNGLEAFRKHQQLSRAHTIFSLFFHFRSSLFLINNPSTYCFNFQVHKCRKKRNTWTGARASAHARTLANIRKLLSHTWNTVNNK